MADGVNDSIFQGYAYDYTALPPLAMQQGLPLEELPALDWIWKTTLVALRILSNELLGDHEATRLLGGRAHLGAPSANEFVELIRGIWGRLLAATPSERPKVLADYAGQFRTIALPPSANLLFEDDAFAWWRVAGPNPTVITRAANAGQLTNDGLRSIPQFARDDLDALIASGRLVIADYRKPLADLENGANGGVPKFAYKPVAWFGVPAGAQKLVPLAILPRDDSELIYAPPAGAESWPWRAAKTLVSSADTNHHELIAHLGRTHLFVEPFIVATHLALADSHPVSLLLRPHFEGTIFINWAAVRFLIDNGGGADHLLAGTIQSSRQVAVESVTGMTFDDAIIPRALARRGFGGPVPLSFPYRDDALTVWAAIRAWVASYVAIFFTSDATVRNDRALRAWAQLVRA